MIIKENLKKMQKVGMSIWSKNGKLIKGKKSFTFTIYDATPEKVLEVVEEAFKKQIESQ